MPLPKKPVGGAGREPAPLPVPEITLPEPLEEFALPDLDDLDFAPLPQVNEVPMSLPVTPPVSDRVPVRGVTPPVFTAPVLPVAPVPLPKPEPEHLAAAAPAVSRETIATPSSPVENPTFTSQNTVSDESLYPDDEDEETQLNRLLGLDEDDDEDEITPIAEATSSQNTIEENFDEELDDDTPEPVESPQFSDTSQSISEDVSSENDEDEDDSEIDFDSLIRQLEEENSSLGGDQESVISDDEPDTEDDDEDEDVYDEELTLPTPDRYSLDSNDDSSEDDSSSNDDTGWDELLSQMEKEVLEVDGDDTNDFSSEISEDNDSEDDDEDDEGDDWVPPEDDFVPPANPFAIPEEFADPDIDEDEDEESVLPDLNDAAEADWDEEDPEEEIESDDSEEEDDEDDDDKPSIGQKLAGMLSVSSLKDSIADYFAKIKAELHDEEPPAPRSSRKNSEEEEDAPSEEEEEDSTDDEEDDGKGKRRKSRGGSKKLFGFLSPIKTLYMGLVNLIFGIISGILGILAKLPLIGFIFSAALGATQILRGIATYLPLVFVIGGLATISYFSVPRDSQILMPDNGGATFTEFAYDSNTHTVSGLVTNTGDIIAEVQPEFKVMTIQPELNPLTWFMPSETAVCTSDTVWVDIDGAMPITVECSGDITGFIPRVTGELK